MKNNITWKLREHLREQLARETGYQVFPAGIRSHFALVYPNSYFVGMSNLGLHIIYELLNRRPDTACERFFLPEKKEMADYERSRTPLMSLETQQPLYEFPLIGFAVSFEMDYFHVLDILAAGKVRLLAAERGEREPLVIAGGPCATFNPEPLSRFVDAFIIGEGEAVLPQFMDVYYAGRSAGLSREELLRRLAVVPGVYVPSLYTPEYGADGQISAIHPQPGAPSEVRRQWVQDLDAWPAHTVIVTENTEFNLYLIETARGCGRHCRFCMAGYCFRQPRNRSRSVLQQEIAAAKVYRKRIGLMGAAISDYPEIDALCGDILGEGLTMSVASFRADSVTKPLVEALVASGMQTLTIAPEAGSARMRSVINKGIEEQHLFQAMALGLAAGIRHYRLYIMIGLPYEEPEDIEAILDLTLRLKDYLEAQGNRGTLTLSVNPFIPKPFTPFQWMPMAPKAAVEASLKRLRLGIAARHGIEMIAEPVREAYVQGVLARGDRHIADVLYAAWQLGGAKAFRRAMKDADLDAAFYLHRMRPAEEIFPWQTLNMGFRQTYLYEELQRAAKLQPTKPCFDGCQRCGVCGK